ncbi:MAG: PAS domain S-box protein, partial [Acidobacteriota bacterium]
MIGSVCQPNILLWFEDTERGYTLAKLLSTVGFLPQVIEGLPATLAANAQLLVVQADTTKLIATAIAWWQQYRYQYNIQLLLVDLPAVVISAGLPEGVSVLEGKREATIIVAHIGYLLYQAAYLRSCAAEAELASHRIYEELLQKSTDLFFTHDVDGVVLEVTAGIKAVLGYQPEEVIGRRLAEIVPSIYRQQVDEYLREIHEKTNIRGLLTINNKQGQECVLEYNSSPIYNNGKLSCVSGMARDVSHTIELQRKLAASEARYKDLVENSDDIIYTRDMDGRLLSLNQPTASFFGYPLEQLIGRRIQDFFEDKEILEQQIIYTNQILLAEKTHRMISTMRNFSGEVRTIEFNTSLIRDSDGHPTGVRGIGRDLTEKVDTNRRLLTTIAQLKEIARITADILHFKDYQQLLHQVVNAIAEHSDYQFLLLTLFKEQSPYHETIMSANSTISPDMLARLNEQVISVARAIDQIHAGIKIEVPQIGAAYYFPTHLQNLINKKECLAIYKSDIPYSGGEGRWHKNDELLIPIVGRNNNYLGYLSLDDPRSGRAPDPHTVLPIVCFTKQIAQIIERIKIEAELSHAVTELTLVNDELKVLNKTKAEFAAMLVHDLKSPVTMILGALDILEDSLTKEDKAAWTVLARCRKSCEGIIYLFDELLQVYRLDSEELHLDSRYTSLHELIDGAIGEVEMTALTRQIAINSSLPTECWKIKVDSSKMQRAILNLLNNALKFTPNGGEIRVQARLVEDASVTNGQRLLTINIIDNGEGIPAES